MRSVLVIAAVGVLLAPAPAHAAVKFDRATMTGFVDRADVQKAFGWTDTVFERRAPKVTFRLAHTTIDRYRVVCRRGGSERTFTLKHDRIFGHTDLAADVVEGRRGYGRQITGFRITGAVSGISGIAILPPEGGPCPSPSSSSDDEVLVSAKLLSAVEREALTGIAGEVSKELMVTRRPAAD